MAPFYIVVSVFAVVTGLSGVVVLEVYEIPNLARTLDHGDSAVREAGWRAIQSVGPRIVRDILQALGQLIHTHAGTNWPRIGRVWLAIYVGLLCRAARARRLRRAHVRT